jgi:hypothetical protein
MIAPVATPLHPVQLVLDLRAPTARLPRSMERRPYWDAVDMADLGGTLCARRPGVRAVIDAQCGPTGLWLGYHDVLLGQLGSSAVTRPQPTRQDALASAAHAVAQTCRRILAAPGHHVLATTCAARQVIRWLGELDLL